VEPQFFQ